MIKKPIRARQGVVCTILPLTLCVTNAVGAPLPGGTLDPLAVPKYTSELDIPPVMPKSTLPPAAPGPAAVVDYNISVRQFQQQVLPTVDLAGLPTALPPTPVWGHGLEEDPIPAVGPAPAAQSTFSYPSFTIETLTNRATRVRWLNELVAIDPLTNKPYPVGDPLRTFLPHILKDTSGTGTVVDRSLHWANPENAPCFVLNPNGTDCMPDPGNPANQLGGAFDMGVGYAGPVPMVSHVHGAHVNPRSDGYPEAWWLPDASNVTPCVTLDPPTPAGCYVPTGTQFQSVGDSPAGSARFVYPNDQPAGNIWYHDHTLGMTRNNVYAGPAGFWMIRGGPFDGATDGTAPPGPPVAAVLPGEQGVIPGLPGRPSDPRDPFGCDPNFDAACRASIREIPVVIQDRSFNTDGTLFFPDSRDFFETFRAGVTVPYLPTTDAAGNVISDIAPIWNPEFFGNMIAVNGKTWPKFEVMAQRYRLRLLNGSDSRFLNLAMYTIPPKRNGQPNNKAFTVNNAKILRNVANGKPGWTELPFYQIGSDQGFLPQVVEVMTGFATPLPGDGTIPAPLPNQDLTGTQALLMGSAERVDAVVDFTGLPTGTVVRIVNTAPDAPFGGFPDIASDQKTTGQVLSFVVVDTIGGWAGPDPSTPAQNLMLNAPLNWVPPPTPGERVRPLSLNEEESGQICVRISANGSIRKVTAALPPPPLPADQIAAVCAALNSVPFAPKAALLGTFDPTPPGTGLPTPLLWFDDITEGPLVGASETWEFWNFTVDSHPIHVHLVEFEVVSREPFDPITGALVGPLRLPEVNELGPKDTVIAYPGEVTRIRAKFDIAGLYVWHCHILSHEDNEMMRPFCVKGNAGQTSCPGALGAPRIPIAPGA